MFTGAEKPVGLQRMDKMLKKKRRTADTLVQSDPSPESIRRRRGNHNWPRERRNSQLPFLWRVTHTFRWLAQVAAAEISLLAFFLLLLMVFSGKWLYPSGSRFFQRCPVNVTNKVYSFVSTMSMGLMYLCKSKGCSNAGSDSYNLWIHHPIFLVAMMTFLLALALGLILTIWLHLPYLPYLQSLPNFSLVGTILSFCEVTFIFLTLLLFPINLWIFELKRNVSIPIGWSYFIGWLVFKLYIICGILCYLNHKNFWSLILSGTSMKIACFGSSSIVEESPSDQELKTISDTSSYKEEVPNLHHNEQPPASDCLSQTYSSFTQSLV
ncbi:outer dense fiber protein 4 [Perognathus longimembris pacificus]|uniref:outer dense fiber protein 4 n=1 Tax=Perognathus longimembris pacificus TaxID=214514 RepID=UPI0020186E80|nr:outer dense fiber protein 4 [Perognathus longimembris pacificus]